MVIPSQTVTLRGKVGSQPTQWHTDGALMGEGGGGAWGLSQFGRWGPGEFGFLGYGMLSVCEVTGSSHTFHRRL